MIPRTTDNYLQCIVPENIHIPPSHPRTAKEIPCEVGWKGGNFRGGGGGGGGEGWFRCVLSGAPDKNGELLKTNSSSVQHAVGYFRCSFLCGRLNASFTSYAIVYCFFHRLHLLSNLPLYINCERP